MFSAPILTLMAARQLNSMLQADQRHLVLCVATVVARHFPVDRTVLVSSLGDDSGLVGTLLDTIHGLKHWPALVQQPSSATVLQPYINVEKKEILFLNRVWRT
jgi:hypothetical protein